MPKNSTTCTPTPRSCEIWHWRRATRGCCWIGAGGYQTSYEEPRRAWCRSWRPISKENFREGRTAWRLFNAFTEVLKGQIDRLPRRTQALHGLMDSVCGLTGRAILQAEDAEVLAATAA
jgi:hypothetical protein